MLVYALCLWCLFEETIRRYEIIGVITITDFVLVYPYRQ